MRYEPKKVDQTFSDVKPDLLCQCDSDGIITQAFTQPCNTDGSLLVPAGIVQEI